MPEPSPSTSDAGAPLGSGLLLGRLELLITLLGLLGLALFLAFYDRAFPSAAIELELSRTEIAERAQAYLERHGYDLQDFQFALYFGEDSQASIFLQHTLGIPETNRLVRAERLPIWTWEARWFRPLQKEEFSVSLAPDGTPVGFSHSLPEDAPGASLPQADSRALAEAFLVQDRGWSPEDWELASASTQEKPGGRVDHYFEWKRRGFAVGEGDLRLAVGVQGERVDSSTLWLRVPEAFLRTFSEQRGRAGFLNDLSSTIGFFGFGLAGLLAYLIAVWRGGLRWYAGFLPGLAVALVSLLSGLNQLSLYKSWYSTTQDYTLFWVQRVLNLFYSAGFSAAPVFVLWAGGRRLSRQVWPRQDKILPRGDNFWETLARSAWRGLMLAGMMGGYVVIFYLVATQLLGGWTPLDNPYTSLYATPFPFLGPLRGGLLPAVTEELFFRLVGISLLLLLTRRRWLALLVPGALWAFAHLGYVRDPFYMRGVELLIAAVFLEGLFFIRFDLTTVVVAHFAYNAGLGALPLLRSGEPYFVASGLIVVGMMLAPVFPGLAGAIRRRLRGKMALAAQPQITAATQGDIKSLASLPIAGVDWAALLDDPASALLSLRAGDQVVGAAAGRLGGGDGDTAEVLALYVGPGWRRRYWGSALVEGLCVELRARGARSVQAVVEAGDRDAAAFWATQGWQPAVKVFSHSLAPSRPFGWRDAMRWVQDRRRGSRRGREEG